MLGLVFMPTSQSQSVLIKQFYFVSVTIYPGSKLVTCKL